MKIRTEADTAVEQFVKEGIEICKKLVSLKRHSEACYILQRLSALKVKEEEVKNLAQEMGKENSELIRRPDTTKGADTEKAEKLLLEAQKAFKSGKLDEASVTCKAALEVDPGLAAAVALLSDIADKMGKTEESLTYGLTYLLFPPDAQSAARAEEIEKSISKASAELKSFFEATRKCADTICKLAEKAMREKKESDIKYLIERLVCVSHRTKGVDASLTKVAKLLEEMQRKIKIGKLLASDDFNKPFDWFYDPAKWRLENGRLVCKPLKAGSGPRAHYGSLTKFEVVDFYLECELEPISDAPSDAMGGVTFRGKCTTQAEYAFVILPNGNFGLWYYDYNDNKKDLTRYVPSEHIRRDKAKNIIAVGFVGNQIFCYINGKMVFTCKDNSAAKGWVGLVAFGSTYAFDNFKVYEAFLPGK